MADIYDFVMNISSVFGSCGFTCDICKTDYKACDGEFVDNKGNCPDNDSCCPSGSLDFTRYTHNGNDQVCENCFEKVFGLFKKNIDSCRSGLLMYFRGELAEERKSLEYEEELLESATTK